MKLLVYGAMGFQSRDADGVLRGGKQGIKVSPMVQRKMLPAGVTLFLALGGVLQACPTCKDSFTKTDGSNGSKMVSSGLNSTGLGFGWSVIFMLAAPATVASGLIWLVVKNGRHPAGGKVS